MKINQIIKNILQNIPEDILEVSEELKDKGITKEIKVSYYLYKQLTKKMLEADIDFHIADSYDQKQKFYKKNFEQLENNKVVCKHINQAYQKLLADCVSKYKKENINLDIKSEIELLHPENEMTHSDLILICNGKPIFCNPILDLLESKAEYRIKYFARSLEKNPHPLYAKRLQEKYGDFYSMSSEDKEELDKQIGEEFHRSI